MKRQKSKPSTTLKTMKPEAILETRTSLNLTQLEVARGCGVTLSAARAWETMAYSPTPENMDKLVKFFESKLKD